jgi:putative ABC transport system substrate-binding protein
VTFFGGSRLGPKRIELLHELAPKSALIAVLVDPNYAGFVRELPNLEAAGRAVGQKILEVKAENEGELDAAFAKIVGRRWCATGKRWSVLHQSSP